MQTKQAIILGGGTSVLEGINSGLFEKIQQKFTVGLNFSHHFFRSTILMFVDETFIADQKYSLKQLPLIIGKQDSGAALSTNSYLFPATHGYQRDCSSGIYKSTLVGIFALSFLIYVMDEGEIFLLGYDYGAKKGKGDQGRAYDHSGHALTHWYQEGNLLSVYTGQPEQIEHRGLGKVSWYEALHRDGKHSKPIPRAEHEFEVYRNESKVKIYNVSLDSKIPTFSKISYEQFYQMLNCESYDQNALREEIRTKTIELIKAQKG